MYNKLLINTDKQGKRNQFPFQLFFDVVIFTDHYLVVAKVRERLAVRKQAAQKFDGGRFNLRKLNDLEVRKQYQIEITNRFAALENVRTRT